MRISFFPVIFSLLSLTWSGLHAQESTVTVSGEVLAEDGNTPLPFAHVLSKKWATTTNVNGLFEAPLERNDTIRVSYVGYKDFRFTIPRGHRDDEYDIIIQMVRDTIYLQEAEIFFLPENEEDFKEAILALELNDQEYKYAMRNINLLKQQLKIASYDKDAMDAAENARYYLSGPQPVYFNFVFDKIRDALWKSKKRRDALPDLAEINPSAFAEDNNRAGITDQQEEAFSDTLSIESDTTFQYILKQPLRKDN